MTTTVPARLTPVRIPADHTVLHGDLVIPVGAQGLVLFAHGSGSSRHSPCNRQVATRLQLAGFGTLLLDLLTPAEEQVDRLTAHLRFDIPLLARRLVAAIDWAEHEPLSRELPIGVFGASTGAAAALVAAAERPAQVQAIVSRGGRPDLAGSALPLVQAPTLLIVGSRDIPVLEVNRVAAGALRAPHEIAIVAGATHLFEEPGALAEVEALASRWFVQHLRPSTASSRAAVTN